jgi:flagellar basal-body rod protein FlgG
VQLITSRIDHSMGTVAKTASPLDLAIEGEGFFVVTHPDEGESYTRCGRFSRGEEGRLSLHTSRGDLTLTPEIRIPGDCAALLVARDGEVSIRRESGEPEKIGVIGLALFVSPAQLIASNDALFKPSPQSGSPQLGRPADGLRGGLLQHSLERSNVDVDREQALLRRIDEWLQQIGN